MLKDIVGCTCPFIVTSAVKVYSFPLVTVFVFEKLTYPLDDVSQVAIHTFPCHSMATRSISSYIEFAVIETVHVAVVPLKAIPGLMIILRGVAAALALSGTTTSKIAISNAIFFI